MSTPKARIAIKWYNATAGVVAGSCPFNKTGKQCSLTASPCWCPSREKIPPRRCPMWGSKVTVEIVERDETALAHAD